MEEKYKIEITRYRTPDGIPTCAADWPAGQICCFLQTYKMGCAETCFFIRDEKRKQILMRANGVTEDGGFLIPFNGCPVWKEIEGQNGL